LVIFQLPTHAQGKERPMKQPTSYRTIQVDGLSIFYREAGPKDAPTLLLLHGLLILYGKTGRGKTHLAAAIGYRAIQNGFETFCTTAAELVEDLSNTSQKGRLQESLLTYTRPHVLLVDEVGYLTYGPDAANVLFHVVNDRHLRKRPMIFPTTKPLSEWGKVLHDEDLAAAILDRI